MQLPDRGFQFVPPLPEPFYRLAYYGVNIDEDVCVTAVGTIIKEETHALEPQRFSFRLHPLRFFLG